MRTDPFRELDRLSQQLVGRHNPGTWSRPSPMPIDAYRAGQEFVVQFDLPGVATDAIELQVERNVLTVKAELAVPTPASAGRRSRQKGAEQRGHTLAGPPKLARAGHRVLHPGQRLLMQRYLSCSGDGRR